MPCSSHWAIWIAVALLFLVFRAPIAALIPLVTMYVAVEVTLAILAWGASYGLYPVFDGLKLYVSVLVYGAGVDYSVLLVSRTEEERQDHTPTRGVTEAVVKTGGLISGAGLIMAGTFSALLIGGRMASMDQLGFALCVGVLLDTFLVRPLLVPSFLDLLARWRFYRLKLRRQLERCWLCIPARKSKTLFIITAVLLGLTKCWIYSTGDGLVFACLTVTARLVAQCNDSWR